MGSSEMELSSHGFEEKSRGQVCTLYASEGQDLTEREGGKEATELTD